jgi:hypothetical protein
MRPLSVLVTEIMKVHCPDRFRRKNISRAITGSFHSDGLIGRDARTTSVPGRAYSAAQVDSGGASRRL